MQSNSFKINLILIVFLLSFSSCIPSKIATSDDTKKTSKNLITKKGEASYYANKFHGRPTASGEKYNKNKFTAAHRTLPFGTMVEVTNLTNGKSVTVKINDRGPHKKSRIIDLSRAAAEQIDLIKAGIAQVEIRYEKPENQ